MKPGYSLTPFEKPGMNLSPFLQKGLRSICCFNKNHNFINPVLTVIFLMFLNLNSIFAYLTPSKTNITVTDSLLNNYITKLADFIKEKSIQSVNFINNRTDESRYIEQLLLSEFKIKGITITSINPDSANFNLRITVKELKIRYLNHEINDDSLSREIIVDLTGMLSFNKTGLIEQIPELKIFYNDIISRNDFDFIRNNEFRFANPEVPEKPGSWFRDIVQPIVMIAAAATTIVLLFTVRSK